MCRDLLGRGGKAMRIVLDVVAGPAKGRQFSFHQPDCFLVGRSRDAHISLPDDKHLSRQHFLLEISPPDCTLSDLDSKNGVFVNGMRYGGRKAPKPGIQQAPDGVKERRLKHGDLITVGDTRLKLSIYSEHIQLGEQPDMTVAAPAQDFDEYRIEGELARGPLGIVYKAFDIRTGRPAVVKVMTPRGPVEPAQITRLQQELAVISQVRHPRLVRFLKHWNDGNNFYFAFEYVDGMNLSAFLEQRGGKLALQDALPLMLEILDGLAFTHQLTINCKTSEGRRKSFKGIVHRHLKPQNILLSYQDNHWIPKIDGFGFSQGLKSAGLSNMTSSEGFGNAPLYWPRERITHYCFSHPASDVFSIAAVLYEMLSGAQIREGFQGILSRSEGGTQPPLSEYLRVIAMQPPVPIRQRSPQLPEALAEVIDKALGESALPQDRSNIREILTHLRYPNAAQFRQTLLKACQKSGIDVALNDEQRTSSGWKTGTIIGDAGRQSRETGGTIIYSAIQSAGDRRVALFLLDVMQSTQFVINAGDTSFSTLIGNLYRRIHGHSSAAALSFLKCTGDGFLAVYQNMSAAFSLAESFLDAAMHQGIKVRIALHWGSVKHGPGGDVLGKEVHRLCRIEGVQAQARLESEEEAPALPSADRILVTREAKAQLQPPQQQKCRSMGTFRLKGFTETCPLWGMWN